MNQEKQTQKEKIKRQRIDLVAQPDDGEQKTYQRKNGKMNKMNKMKFNEGKQDNEYQSISNSKLSFSSKNINHQFPQQQKKQISQPEQVIKGSILDSNQKMINQLLELESNWIRKQTQIRQYIQGLHKKIEQKQITIEKVQKENYKLMEIVKKGYGQNFEVINNFYDNGYNEKGRKQFVDERKRYGVEFINEKMGSVSIKNFNGKNKQLSKQIEYSKLQSLPEQREQDLVHSRNLINESYNPKISNTVAASIKKQKQLQISSDQVHSVFYNTQNTQKQQQPSQRYNQINQSQDKKQLFSQKTFNAPKDSQNMVESNIINKKQLNEENITKNIDESQKQYNFNNKNLVKSDKKVSLSSKQQQIINEDISSSKYQRVDEGQLQRRVIDNVRKILEQNKFISHHTHHQTHSYHHYNKDQDTNNNSAVDKDTVDHNGLKVNQQQNSINNNRKDNQKLQLKNYNNQTLINMAYRSPSLTSSSVNQQSVLYGQKQRQIRQTSTTDQTYQQNFNKLSPPKQSIIIKKNSIKVAEYQNTQKRSQNNSNQQKQQQRNDEISDTEIYNQRKERMTQQQKKRHRQIRHNHKSSKTITFSGEPQQHYRLTRGFQQNDFHSQNKIVIPQIINADSVNVSPYQSAQGTPQSSVKMIKVNSYQQQGNSQGISQVDTVKRNPMSRKQQRLTENNNYLGSNNSKNNFQSSNNNSNQRNSNKVNNNSRFSSQKVYDQFIANISSEKGGVRFRQSNKLDVDKKSSMNSEDDPFSVLLQQGISSKNIILGLQKQPADQQESISIEKDNSNRNAILNRNRDKFAQRSAQRKKTRMNTKFTNLDYSLTQSNISMSEIDGSLFRQNNNNNNSRERQNNHKKSLVYVSYAGVHGVVPIQQDERNQRESYKVDYQLNTYQNQYNQEHLSDQKGQIDQMQRDRYEKENNKEKEKKEIQQNQISCKSQQNQNKKKIYNQNNQIGIMTQCYQNQKQSSIQNLQLTNIKKQQSTKNYQNHTKQQAQASSIKQLQNSNQQIGKPKIQSQISNQQFQNSKKELLNPNDQSTISIKQPSYLPKQMPYVSNNQDKNYLNQETNSQKQNTNPLKQEKNPLKQEKNQLKQEKNPLKQEKNIKQNSYHLEQPPKNTKQTLKSALKYNGRARLLLQQNSQTQSKHQQKSLQLIDHLQKINYLQKKLSMSSSAGSKFYYPHQQQKQKQQTKPESTVQNNKQKKTDSQLIFNPLVYQCNIKEKTNIRQNLQQKIMQKKQSPADIRNQHVQNKKIQQNRQNLNRNQQQDEDHILQRLSNQSFSKQAFTKQNSSFGKENKIASGFNKKPSVLIPPVPRSNMRGNQEKQLNSSVSDQMKMMKTDNLVSPKYESNSSSMRLNDNKNSLSSSKNTKLMGQNQQNNSRRSSQHNYRRPSELQEENNLLKQLQQEDNFNNNKQQNTKPKRSQSSSLISPQSTKVKQPEFDERQYWCYTASNNKQNNSSLMQQQQQQQQQEEENYERQPQQISRSKLSNHNKEQSRSLIENKQPSRSLSNKQRPGPQTKSTAFKQKTQSNNTNIYYLQKTPSQSSQQRLTNHAFKKMYKFTTESSQQSQYQKQFEKQQQQQQQRIQYQYQQQFRQIQKQKQFQRAMQKQRKKESQSLHSNSHSQTSNSQIDVDVDRILFQNSMLKSYNTTLQNKIKKSGKMEKLIEKFNSQNVSIRNKIHKKSIS